MRENRKRDYKFAFLFRSDIREPPIPKNRSLSKTIPENYSSYAFLLDPTNFGITKALCYVFLV